MLSQFTTGLALIASASSASQYDASAQTYDDTAYSQYNTPGNYFNSPHSSYAPNPRSSYRHRQQQRQNQKQQLREYQARSLDSIVEVKDDDEQVDLDIDQDNTNHHHRRLFVDPRPKNNIDFRAMNNIDNQAMQVMDPRGFIHIADPRASMGLGPRQNRRQAPRHDYSRSSPHTDSWAPQVDSGAGVSDDVDREGWFSQYQEFSKPRINYTPLATYPVFAMCQLNDPASEGISGTILLAQLPHQAVQVIGDITGLGVDSVYSVKINELGRLDDAELEDGQCLGTGEEFNPLTETDYHGEPNQFQDPSRGRFDDITGVEGTTNFEQAHLLQNLSGKESLIGRSLMLTVGEGDDQTILSCCTIGLDATPDFYKTVDTRTYGDDSKGDLGYDRSNRRQSGPSSFMGW